MATYQEWTFVSIWTNPCLGVYPTDAFLHACMGIGQKVHTTVFVMTKVSNHSNVHQCVSCSVVSDSL